MQEQKVQRLLVLSEYGVLPNETGGYLFENTEFPAELKELSLQYAQVWELLEKSDVQYTMVCTERILDATEGKAYITSMNTIPDSGIPTIQAGDLARFLLREVTANEWLGQRVGIRNC
jgi:putative NADH-flavin reductase